MYLTTILYLTMVSTLSLATPAPAPSDKRKPTSYGPNPSPSTRPFQIIVSTPNLPTFAAMYLTSNGTATSIPSKAATCHIADTELYCSSTIPIGAGTGAWEALLAPLQGKDSINAGWSIGKDGTLGWKNGRFENVDATFKLELDGSSGVAAGVYAVLGPQPISDLSRLSTPAQLLSFVPSNW